MGNPKLEKRMRLLTFGRLLHVALASNKRMERDPTREHFASQMFSRVFSMPVSAEPEPMKPLRINSGSFRVCDANHDHFMDQSEAQKCSESYFQGIGRPAIPLYFDHQSGKLIGDHDPVDGKLNRREWETIHHQLSYAISVSMISLIKNKEVADLQATDLMLIADEKVFLEEQLKYYFEFSDNRWNLNVLESDLQDKSEWNHIEVAILINRLYNDFIRKHVAK